MPVHPCDRLARKAKDAYKNMETVNYNFEVQLRDDDGEFVKQAPVHPRDGLAGKVRGAYNDMETVNYNADVQPTHEAV